MTRDASDRAGSPPTRAEDGDEDAVGCETLIARRRTTSSCATTPPICIWSSARRGTRPAFRGRGATSADVRAGALQRRGGRRPPAAREAAPQYESALRLDPALLARTQQSRQPSSGEGRVDEHGEYEARWPRGRATPRHTTTWARAARLERGGRGDPHLTKPSSSLDLPGSALQSARAYASTRNTRRRSARRVSRRRRRAMPADRLLASIREQLRITRCGEAMTPYADSCEEGGDGGHGSTSSRGEESRERRASSVTESGSQTRSFRGLVALRRDAAGPSRPHHPGRPPLLRSSV